MAGILSRGRRYTPAGYGGCDLLVPILLPKSNKISYLSVQVINRPNDYLGQELEKEAFQSINLAADLLRSLLILGS